MHVLIATIESSQMEDTLLISQQFIKENDDQPTFLKVLYPDNHAGKAHDRSKEIELKLQEYKNKIREILNIEKFRAKLRIGKPEVEILTEARQYPFDLLIFDDPDKVKRNLGLKRTITQRITERAPCSVLIVRGQSRPFRKILLCDSGAEESRLMKKYLTKVIGVLGKEEMPTVLHVMSQISAGPGVRGTQLRAEAEELIENNTPEGDLLKRDMETLKEAGLEPTVKIRHGLVVDEILAEAKSGDYDLVVIGINQERWQQFLLDDLAQQIIKKLDRPILVLK